MVKNTLGELPRKVDTRVVTIEETKKPIYTFENALRETQHGKFNVYIVIAGGLSILGMGLENMNVSVIIPYAKCDLQLTTYQQGLLNSVAFIGIVLSSHCWGFLADTWGRRKAMRASVTAGFIFCMISVFSTSIEMLIFCRFWVGVSFSGIQAATFSYVAEFHADNVRKRATAMTSVFLPTNLMILPMLGWYIIPLEINYPLPGLNFTSWRLYMMCGSMFNIIVMVLLWLLPESPKFLLSIGKKEEALEVLRTMYTINTGKDKESYPVKYIENDTTGQNISDVKGILGMLNLIWNQTWPLFVKPYRGATLSLCYIVFILYSIGQGQVMWLPEFLSQLQEYIGSGKTFCEVVGTPSVMSLNTTLNEAEIEATACQTDTSNNIIFKALFLTGVFFTIMPGCISFYIEQIGPKRMLYIWLPSSIVFGVSLFWVTQFHIMAVAYVFFLSAGLCAQTLSAISVDLFPSNIRAMSSCLILMFGRIGSIVGSNIIAFMLYRNCEGLIYINSFCILTCLPVFYFLVRKT